MSMADSKSHPTKKDKDVYEKGFYEVHEIVVPHLGHVPVAKGDFGRLPRKVQQWIAKKVSIKYIHVMRKKEIMTQVLYHFVKNVAN